MKTLFWQDHRVFNYLGKLWGNSAVGWREFVQARRSIYKTKLKQQQMVKELTELLDYPDHLLADIGINRGDLLLAIRQPEKYRFDTQRRLIKVSL